ncbi:MAG: SurA N-terminal domain-containing protein [Alphaproteobacteria bacterium]|jgi:hypothetical protein|nr:SurA N-terminal domain-containing protein [Alphaproteobacteria bacterium]
MLEFFRKEKNQFFVKGIMLLLAGSFVFLGFTGYMSGYTSSAPIIETKNHKIGLREFHGLVENSVQMMKYYSKDFNTKTFINNPAFFNNFLRQLSYTALVDSYGKDRSFIMSNDQAYEIISNTKEFQDADGTFNYDTFKYAIQNAGYTEKGFINKIKEDSVQKLTNQILTIPSIVPDFYKNNFFKVANETREIKLVEVSPKNFSSTTAPTAEELQNLYEQKKIEFLNPESRSVSYIKIDETVENQTETAENILDDIIGGEDLDELSKKYNVGKFDVSNIKKDRENKDKIVQENLETIFSLEKGEESNLVNHGKSLIVFVCNNIKESTPKSFNEVKSKLITEWTNKKKKEAAYKSLNDVIKSIKSDKSFEEAAASNGLKFKTVKVSKKDEKLEKKLKDAILSAEKENQEYIIMGEEKYYLFSINKTIFPTKDIKTLSEDEIKEVDQAFQESLANEQIEKLQRKYRMRVYNNVLESYVSQYRD